MPDSEANVSANTSTNTSSSTSADVSSNISANTVYNVIAMTIDMTNKKIKLYINGIYIDSVSLTSYGNLLYLSHLKYYLKLSMATPSLVLQPEQLAIPHKKKGIKTHHSCTLIHIHHALFLRRLRFFPNSFL